MRCMRLRDLASATIFGALIYFAFVFACALDDSCASTFMAAVG